MASEAWPKRSANSLAPALGHLVTFTGHSLGGGLASVQGLATGRPTITFNAAGIHPASARALGLDFSRNGSITAYNVLGDQVTYLQEQARWTRGAAPNAIGRRIELDPYDPPRQNANSALSPGDRIYGSWDIDAQRGHMHQMNWVLYSMFAGLYFAGRRT